MRNSYHALIVKIFREFWSRLRLNAEANARCLDTACRLSDTCAKIYCGYHTIGGNASAEIKAIADLWYPYTSSQQVGTIYSDATTPIPRSTVDWNISQADDFRTRGGPWTIK